MVLLDTIELPFEFLDFGAIYVHLFTGAGPVFVELVDDQRGVPVYHEAFDAELNGYTEFVETRFIFGGVVGGQKIYSENVLELILGRRNEQNASTSTVDVEGAVEIHHPVLEASSRDGLLDLGSLSDKVSQRLQLNGRLASKFYRISAELDCPLDDAAIGLFITENVP